MESIKEMEERHHKEFETLRNECHHRCVEVIHGSDYHDGWDITLICRNCGLPIVGFEFAKKSKK